MFVFSGRYGRRKSVWCVFSVTKTNMVSQAAITHSAVTCSVDIKHCRICIGLTHWFFFTFFNFHKLVCVWGFLYKHRLVVTSIKKKTENVDLTVEGSSQSDDSWLSCKVSSSSLASDKSLLQTKFSLRAGIHWQQKYTLHDTRWHKIYIIQIHR